MIRILTSPPIWVWPLFLLLIAVGLRAMRDRQAPAMLIYLLPLLGVLALRSVFALHVASWVWGFFVLAYILGILAGYRLQGRWIMGRSGKMVQLKGEPLTLVVMMVVFSANFVSGFLQEVFPHVYGNIFFHTVFATVLALGAGSFAGRALRVWQKR